MNRPWRMAQRREPAQIMALFGLSIVAFVGLVALVLDGGSVYVQRRTAQTSADAAALAGARELRNAASSSSVPAVSTAITTYAQANAFGVQPSVLCAYFVGTDGTTNVGTILNNSATVCSGTAVATIPSAASGVHVDVQIPFHTYLAGMLGVYDLTADGHATSQVGVLTAFDARNAPLIVCAGGTGNALRIATITPAVHTSTPGVLAATPASMPSFNPGSSDLSADTFLVTPGAGIPTPPAYLADASKDGRTYYLKGQDLTGGSPSGDCGASGFKGAAATTQPTPYVKDTADGTDDIMWGDTGNSVPQISSRVASSGACAAGTSVDSFNGGDPGCVMVLPMAYDDATGGGPGTRPLKVGAWGAFYVWCLRSTGSGCQVIAGQFLANWPVGGGPAASTWTFGQHGGLTTVRLTS